MLVSYGPILAEYLIMTDLTIDKFIENIAANLAAFKEYLARYLNLESGATDGKELWFRFIQFIYNKCAWFYY